MGENEDNNSNLDKINEWTWSNLQTTNPGNNVESEPVDHFVCEAEVLESRRRMNGQNDESDSENGDNDIIFEDMQLFFHAIGEPQLIEKFLRNKVTLGQLLEFEEQDLINCGVELVGDRKKILANTAQMHCEKWSPSSLHDLTGKSLLSSPGIYIALNDINKHIEYIGVTFRYLKRKLQKQPDLLELGKDYVGIAKVVSELEDVIKTSRSTHNHAHSLRRELGKFVKDATFRPANHIDKEYLRSSQLRQRLPSIIVGTMVAIFSIKIFTYLKSA